MTLARAVFAGDVVQIHRRTYGGHYFLVPNAAMLQLIEFAYALAAERFGLIIHVICVMSNHVHLIATDPNGMHPRFTEFAHTLIALGAKRMYGIDEAVWSPGGVSVQRLTNATAITESIAYIRANPIAAGCVRHEREYHGLIGARATALLETVTKRVRRPGCFGPNSTLPEEVTLTIAPPARLIDELGLEGAASAVAEAVHRHRSEAQRERARSGRRFLGMRRVLSKSIWTCAGALKRAEINPTFKAVFREAIRAAREALKQFRAAYAVALAAFKAGNRDVLFPAGTYLMRIRGCRTAGL